MNEYPETQAEAMERLRQQHKGGTVNPLEKALRKIIDLHVRVPGGCECGWRSETETFTDHLTKLLAVESRKVLEYRAGPGDHWTTDEWSEWSNQLAELVPEDQEVANPEAAQEHIILEYFRHLVATVNSDGKRDSRSEEIFRERYLR